MLKLLTITVVIATYCQASINPEIFEEVFSCSEVTFDWPNSTALEEALENGDYVPKNNLPLGLDRWKDKLFITVPRWKAGVAASLTYISITPPVNKNASLIPYPDWKANTLPKDEETLEDNHIVSTFRVKVDKCDRLWIMDTGLADILGEPKQVSPQAIVVFDLNTDKLIRRYNLKPDDIKEDSFFANIIVDEDPNNCDDTYVYLPDLGGYGIVVYSFAENNSWRAKHNYFHFDPLKGNFNIGGINFQWTDGIFGLALGPRKENGFRTIYFHPLASTREFSVPSQILRNQTLATDPASYYSYKIEGDRGDLTQASASDFDEQTNVLFLTQLNRDGVACWNPRKPLNSKSLGLIAQDKEALIFTNDIKIDKERNLWILSDKLPKFVYGDLDPSEINYRIFKGQVDDIIKNTVCV